MPSRGCGTRIVGGVYIECDLIPGGHDTVILDPPVPIGDLTVNARGVQAIERNGSIHVLDWVGAQWYPLPVDFVEEARVQGISRRMPRNFAFETLTPASRLLLIHPKAYISNWSAYRHIPARAQYCPKGIMLHQWPGESSSMCAGIWWEDLPRLDTNQTVPVGRHTYERPGGVRVSGYPRPHGVTPEYLPAFFMSVSLQRIVVVRDPTGGRDVTARRSLDDRNVQYSLVEE